MENYTKDVNEDSIKILTLERETLWQRALTFYKATPCKTWTSHNFTSSLDCYKNNTVQHFDLKICTKKDMMLDFP